MHFLRKYIGLGVSCATYVCRTMCKKFVYCLATWMGFVCLYSPCLCLYMLDYIFTKSLAFYGEIKIKNKEIKIKMKNIYALYSIT